MKNAILILLTLFTVIAKGQVFSKNAFAASITITTKGIQDNNSNGKYYNVSVGTSPFFNNTTGHDNTAFGSFCLKSNTTGNYNSSVGDYSLYANTSGYNNTATGYNAMSANTGGHDNTAAGMYTFSSNVTGNDNTAIGYYALSANTFGKYNVAFGEYTLNNNTTGSYNTGTGIEALYSNLIGTFNTGNGTSAGNHVIYGVSNSSIGYGAAPKDDYNNTVNMGAYAIANAGLKVRIGDNQVTVIEGQVAWSYPSDQRLKENIVYTKRLGLDFISRLQPVSYNYIADKNKTRYDGFIAQDIEQVMNELNVPFSGLKKSDDGMYSLAYSDFVMPLINAVQELKGQDETLLFDLNELKAKVAGLKAEKAMKLVNNAKNNSSN